MRSADGAGGPTHILGRVPGSSCAADGPDSFHHACPVRPSGSERPPFPATWVRKHEKGRVFYTSMGHREDVWENSIFQGLLLGGLSWAFGNVEADVTPNLEKVAPKAVDLKKE